MPPDGRRRSINIVGLNPDDTREILGGIRNAIERGENMQKIKQTFVNAGYSPEEVEKTLQIAAIRGSFHPQLIISVEPEAPKKKKSFFSSLFSKSEKQIQQKIVEQPKPKQIISPVQKLAPPIQPKPFVQLKENNLPQKIPTQFIQPLPQVAQTNEKSHKVLVILGLLVLALLLIGGSLVLLFWKQLFAP